MTVSSTTSRKSYAGNDVTVAFDTSPVVFFDAADLQVYVIVDATDVATLKTITTHYTVSGGDGTTGTVTMLTAPATGETLLIVRSLAITQGSDFVNNDGSDAEVAEDALDRLTMIAQELDTELDRSFKLPVSDVSGASTELPTPAASKIIGWDSAGTALQNYSPADIDASLVSDFMEAVLDDETAAEARTTLDVPSNAEAVLDALVTTKGDIIVATAASTPARKAVGADGYALQAQSGATDGLQYMPPQAGFALQNGYLDWSVGSNILTVAVKTFAGTDPSATDPVYITFRSVTPGTGSLVVRKLTAATSITIPDTATMGTSNSVAFRLWAVAFDDGGTVRLALINALSGATDIYPVAGFGVASATQDGTGSDSTHVFYSDGAAVTSKAYSTLGFASWESGLATAGTWSGAPTRAQLFGLGMPLPGQQIQLQRSWDGTVATGTTQLPFDDTIPQNTEGVQFMTKTITPSSSANVLEVKHQGHYATSTTDTGLPIALFVDSVASALTCTVAPKDAGANLRTAGKITHRMLAASTALRTFNIRAGTGAAGTTTFNGQAGAREFGGVLNSFLEIAELMA